MAESARDQTATLRAVRARLLAGEQVSVELLVGCLDLALAQFDVLDRLREQTAVQYEHAEALKDRARVERSLVLNYVREHAHAHPELEELVIQLEQSAINDIAAEMDRDDDPK
ncbi:hypothetical protein AB0L82_43330 [Nocardia sp. NPDC052001]|uniref:hypothetical protein n=1 Tax=Nocardia sp. NPDC052001 TaxID=3154853 RepID=UPI00343CFF5D